MARWLISIPIWGERYAHTFVRCALPALLVAVRRLREPVKFIIHTDQEYTLRQAWGSTMVQVDVEFRPVPAKTTYVCLQESHAEVVAMADPGERVVLLNADLVVSGNLLLRCAEHFANRYLAVVLTGVRTNAGPERPPVGAAPRELLIWAWKHRHQIIRDLEWPHGGSMLPTNLFWSNGNSVVARCFHLHPVAIVKQASTSFRSTIDGDLLDCFPRERIHVVTSPDDCSMCEVSPPERRFPVRQGSLNPMRVAASMRTRASATHCWLFTKRIVLCGAGDDDFGDHAVVKDVLSALKVAGDDDDVMASRRVGKRRRR